MEPFQRLLAVVAHPDDAEFGFAGSAAQWADQGVEITYVICTDGASGSADPSIDLSQLARIRESEQRAAAEVLGVREVIFLGRPDGQLRPSDDLRRQLVELIRSHRPEVMVCQNAVRNYASLFGNHPDHLAAGQVTVEAIYPYARNPYAYPELLAAGLEPFSVRDLLVVGTDAPDYFVDVSATVERKLAALACHQSQLSSDRDYRTFVMKRLAETGEPPGMAFAESFRRVSGR